MKLIESKTLASAAASVNFTSIPQTYDDLLLVCSFRSDRATNSGNLGLRLNNDSGSNYSFRRLRGNGSASESLAETYNWLNLYHTTTAGSDTASTFGNTQIYIPNYKSSVAKSLSIDGVNENNATLAYQTIFAGLWTGTAAITSIQIEENFGGNWVQYSSASLYGITKGSDGIVTTS